MPRLGWLAEPYCPTALAALPSQSASVSRTFLVDTFRNPFQGNMRYRTVQTKRNDKSIYSMVNITHDDMLGTLNHLTFASTERLPELQKAWCPCLVLARFSYCVERQFALSTEMTKAAVMMKSQKHQTDHVRFTSTIKNPYLRLSLEASNLSQRARQSKAKHHFNVIIPHPRRPKHGAFIRLMKSCKTPTYPSGFMNSEVFFQCFPFVTSIFQLTSTWPLSCS